MKNLSSAILFIAIISCESPATTEAVEEEQYNVTDTQPSMYAVSLTDAEESIKYYDKLSKEALGVDPIRAFTIRSMDLAEVIGLPTKFLNKAEYHHVRIYMGLDSATSQFKVYLTPVKGAVLSKDKPGKDVILDGPYKGDGELADGDGPYVFDFSKPCPNACDGDSPLNQ